LQQLSLEKDPPPRGGGGFTYLIIKQAAKRE